MPSRTSCRGYRWVMATPAVPPGEPGLVGPVRPPAADPAEIRACLSAEVAGVFDAEWETVLDAAKRSKELAGIHDLLAKWRAFAAEELREPGAYFRTLAAAAEVERTGRAPAGSVSGVGMRARVEARLAEARRRSSLSR